MKEFTTHDIWLSAALSIILNTTPDYRVLNGKVIFVFSGDDRIYRAIAEYNANCNLPAYLYAETIKRLKVEMLTRRQHANGGASNG